MNAVDIAGRRRLVFKFKALELTPKEMQVLISEKYPVSIDTIRRDLRLMASWLPGMLSLQEDEADESLYRLVGLVQMAQRQLAKLSVSADNDNAKVGASRSLAAIACKEIELRQDLGRIPRMPISIQHIEPIDLDGLDEKAVLAMMANFEQAEADRHRRLEYENHHPSEDATMENTRQDYPDQNYFDSEPAPAGGVVETSRLVDTSDGGKRVGGYIVERR